MALMLLGKYLYQLLKLKQIAILLAPFMIKNHDYFGTLFALTMLWYELVLRMFACILSIFIIIELIENYTKIKYCVL